jgi:hypothetical protein
MSCFFLYPIPNLLCQFIFKLNYTLYRGLGGAFLWVKFFTTFYNLLKIFNFKRVLITMTILVIRVIKENFHF